MSVIFPVEGVLLVARYIQMQWAANRMQLWVNSLACRFRPGCCNSLSNALAERTEIGYLLHYTVEHVVQYIPHPPPPLPIAKVMRVVGGASAQRNSTEIVHGRKVFVVRQVFGLWNFPLTAFRFASSHSHTTAKLQLRVNESQSGR